MTDPNYTHFMRRLRRHPWLIPMCMAAAFIIAVIGLNSITPCYSVSIIVGPTAREGAAGRSTRLSLTNLQDEQIRLSPVETAPDETLSDFTRFLQLLTAPEIAKPLVADKDIDIADALLKRGMLSNLARRLAGQPVAETPDATMLADYLQKHLLIESVGRTAMRKVTLRHADARFAIAFLNKLYTATDAHLKDQARLRTAAEIVYLRRALQNVTQTEYRRALTDLLAAQEQTQMMITVDLPFAADVIQAPQAPPAPDWPNAALTFVLAILVGGFIGSSWIYMLAARDANT